MYWKLGLNRSLRGSTGVIESAPNRLCRRCLETKGSRLDVLLIRRVGGSPKENANMFWGTMAALR